MTEPTMPTKREMLTCAIEKYSCDTCPLENPDCGAITATIRKLIESMPEPGGVVAGPRDSGYFLCKADPTPTGGSIPPSGLTEEEVLREKSDSAYLEYMRLASVDECCGEDAKIKDGSFGKKELHAHSRASEELGKHRAYADALNLAYRSRLAQKPKVTWKQYQKILWYESGDKTHVDRILSILGLEVEEEK